MTEQDLTQLSEGQLRRILKSFGAKLRKREADTQETRDAIGEVILAARAKNISPDDIATELGWSVQNVYRVKAKAKAKAANNGND